MKSLNFNFLVLGSGVAGLSFARVAAEYGKVAVISKDTVEETNTLYAQGGIASVTSPTDSFESHIKDTIEAGAGVCETDVVSHIIRKAPEALETLISLGAEFDMQGESTNFSLGKEGGHSKRRILHAGDQTGLELHRVLLNAAKKHPNISILENKTAIDLILNRKGQEVLGLYSLDNNSGEVEHLLGDVTFLATGGAGRVYLYTSNSDVATGDGIAMALRAGVEVCNMEFFQFHPTCLYSSENRTFLITEAMRGEGARLLDINKRPFMDAYHPSAELAPRDVVARAIDTEMKASGSDHVFLDITHKSKDFLSSRFPNIYTFLLENGLDISTSPIPIVPAAHYCCGGIKSDLNGRTSLSRLFVAGECAYTGLHGANRLASNSLLEAIVVAEAAAKKSSELITTPTDNRTVQSGVTPWDTLNTSNSNEEVLIAHAWDEVRRAMWNLVGIVRSDKRLNYALSRINLIKEEVSEYYWNYKVSKDLIEMRNILEISEAIVLSAKARKESRGLHFMSDYPTVNPDFQKPTTIRRVGSKLSVRIG